MSRATVNVELPQDGMLRKSERAKKQEILEKLAQLEARFSHFVYLPTISLLR